MNLFRLAGDMTHLLSIVVLFRKIRTTKSCAVDCMLFFPFSVPYAQFYMTNDNTLCQMTILSLAPGVSLKTQEMYVMVFLTRYIDLFTTYYSFYNILMKLFFIGTSVAIVWYMRFHKVVKQTYNKDQDTFKHYYLVLACFVLALLIPHNYTVMEVLWTFSIYLEAVLILPQLVLLQTSSNIDNLTVNYVFFLGAYRALYLLNWIYRFFTELHRIRWIPWISGLVQTALYADFFYYYIKSWRKQEELRIPA
ncbi:hypothetical protein FEM48_Zijuj03G0197500 [Ziziphus jujuba var. spinosa]|uniref:ER lumen protein-retaining receptor n=1 Tax=Ziziphus jujuba var. spinosa TaxID=714518 RepID=A0A978VS94_ZIZJJ|nr:hypothetical protein FEM48_Zijuj03G0197500 [Ziziphus jujuba var. spinosa]